MSIEERIQSLIKQQEAAKELYVKCQGALDVLKEMLEEEKPSDKK
mgnify:FL=1|tara:strand:+ start:181 stop:315 length:135 start_codon:yes stop_codon:yes gene_type:complete